MVEEEHTPFGPSYQGPSLQLTAPRYCSNAAALMLPVLIGAVPLLATALVFTHFLTPTYLQGQPSLGRQLMHILLGWFLAFFVLTVVLAFVVLGVRLDVLGETLEAYTVATAVTLLDTSRLADPLAYPGFITLASTLGLSIVWALWLRKSANGWRRHLLRPGLSPVGVAPGAVAPGTLKRLSLILLMASALNLLVFGLYMGRLLPGSDLRSNPTLATLVPFVVAMVVVPVTAGVLWIWFSRRRERRDPTVAPPPGGLGFEFPLLLALLFGILFAFAMRENVQTSLVYDPTPATRALNLFPDSAVLFYSRGFAQSGLLPLIPEAGDSPQAALQDINRALELEPHMGIAYMTRAFLHLTAQRPKEALADAKKLIELEPYSLMGYQQKGQALAMQGDLRGALDSLTKITEITIAPRERRFSLRAQCDIALLISEYTRAKACLEAMSYEESLFLESVEFREFLNNRLIQAHLGLGDLAAARDLVLEAGGTVYDGVAVASVLTPVDLPSRFFMVDLIVALGGSSAESIYNRAGQRGLATQHGVRAGINVRFEDQPSSAFAFLNNYTLSSSNFDVEPSLLYHNLVTVHMTEEDAVKGFTFQSDLETYKAWAQSEERKHSPTVVDVQGVPAPKVGDQGARLHGRLSSATGVIEEDVVVFRVGNVVAWLSVSRPTEQDPPVPALELAQIQAQRIREVLSEQ